MYTQSASSSQYNATDKFFDKAISLPLAKIMALSEVIILYLFCYQFLCMFTFSLCIFMILITSKFTSLSRMLLVQLLSAQPGCYQATKVGITKHAANVQRLLEETAYL
jgi:uncharacterized iron-regulated membrane protein